MTATIHTLPRRAGNTITLQRALHDDATPQRLRAVATANAEAATKQNAPRRRLYAQADALRAVADELEQALAEQHHVEPHRKAA